MLKHLVSLLACLLLTTSTLHAQPRQVIVHKELPLGCEVETVAPYRQWKTHRGTAVQGLAVVRYGDASCTALVVRCDGFLLVPEPAWQAFQDKQKVEVVVSKAEGEPTAGPFPIDASLRRTSSRADYRLLKLNDHHVASVPLLASHQLTENTPLLVIWATVASDGKSLKVVQRPATCGTISTERNAFHASLRYTGEPPKDLAQGAIVVDAASGAAVGMIADASQPTHFSHWRYWHDIIQEVGLAPDREAAQQKPPAADSRMVLVPGGPVRLPALAANAYGTDIVCCGDFYCDINPVTNGEWFRWIDTLKDKPPLPLTSVSRLNPPKNNPLIPVCGIRVQDMEYYASAHHKRMITEVEFLRAAYTKDLTWLDQLHDDVQRVEAQLSPLLREYLLSLRQRTQEIKQQAQFQQRQPLGATRSFTPVNVSDITARLQQEAGALWEQVLSLDIVQKNGVVLPGHVHSVQFFPEDKSEAGVRHVHLNVPEACQAVGVNLVLAPKRHAATWDPFLSQVQIETASTADTGPTALSGSVISMSFDPLLKVVLWSTQFVPSAVGMLSLQQTLGDRLMSPSTLVLVGALSYRYQGKVQAGFRCVR